MTKRRSFIRKSTLGVVSAGLLGACEQPKDADINSPTNWDGHPLVISTWNNKKANQAAWEILHKNGSSLDAVEAGVRVPEADPLDRSVGLGGRPDREGKVTLDACIMKANGDYGAVVFMEDIKHAVSIARLVMEKSPHVFLAGNGAKQFALENGFKQEKLLTDISEKEWEEWLVEADYKPVINIENHDTIGMLAMDSKGEISGACTTSGLAYKMRGRVGDSAIIGAGLFIDNEIGGATATGMGEKVVKTLGSYYVVDKMREGKSPEEACRLAVEMIKSKNKDYKDFQVGFVALNKSGEYGGYSLHGGFGYALNTENKADYVSAESDQS